MTGEERRKQIIKLIAECRSPLSGAEMARQLGVSRQVIVQDIALLRAEKYDVLSTNLGYMLRKACKPQRVFFVAHDDQSILDELYTIVDLGGVIIDVQIQHKVYGDFSAQLNIKSRKDAEKLVQNISLGTSIPLKNLTKDVHGHLVQAESKEDLDLIESELRKKGYLREN